MANTADKIVNKALKQEGYVEKKSNAFLNFKTKNAGFNNWTKYNAYFKYSNVYWCANFISWLFAVVYGIKEGKKLLCGGFSASCEVLRQQFIKAKRYDNNPKVADSVFFTGSRHAGANHIGLVIKVNETTIETMEGNTSGLTGVIDNGGGVFRKSYSKNDKRIMGYGHPAYDTVKTTIKINGISVAKPTLKKGNYGTGVKALQKNLNKILGTNLKVDGDFGSNTFEVVKLFQEKYIGKENANGIYNKKTYKAMKLAFKKQS